MKMIAGLKIMHVLMLFGLLVSTNSISQLNSQFDSEIYPHVKTTNVQSVQAIAFNSGVTGSWFNPNQSGHGIFLEAIGNGQYFLSWFAYNRDGNPIFIVGVGTALNDNTLNFNMGYLTGMAWGSFNPDNLIQDNWGTINLVFNSCNSLTVNYNSNYTDIFGTVYGDGSIPFVRLTSIENLSCNFISGSGESISGQVKGTEGNPLEDMLVQLKRDDIIVATRPTSSSGAYKFEGLFSDVDYDLEFIKNGFISTSFRKAQTHRNNGTLFLETITAVPAETGGFSGRVNNALTGDGVQNIKIDFRKGVNAKSGLIAISVTTGANGEYSVSGLNAGSYTGTFVDNEEFSSGSFTIINVANENNSSQFATISPKLPPDEVRVVLTWGETPSDLDSHMTGPFSDNSNDRFHVFFANSGSLNSSPFTNLDIDDVSSFGPETITITQINQGTYRYSVHDFSNRGSTTSNLLASSFAQVAVIIGDTVQTFNVPNQPGTLWTVFELNNSTITPINSMSFEGDIDAITKSQPSNDVELMRNLPEKN